MATSTQERPGVEPARRPRPRALEPAAFFGVAFLAVLWGWWAWQDGAYFEDVILPGAILLGAGAALFAWRTPIQVDLRLSKPAAVAAIALAGLAAWTALSAFWSPVPDIAVLDGVKAGVYALSFVGGLCVANLLGARMEVASAPLAVAGAFAGIAAVIALATGDVPRELLEGDGTLDYPLGYRNATAAFFAIALFPALGVASSRTFGALARGAGLGTATLCSALFLLCQSRGSLPALILALLAYLLLSTTRVRALAWLAAAVLPALATLPLTSRVYTATTDAGLGSVTDELRLAALAIAIAVLAAAALGLAMTRLERRLPGRILGTYARGNRAVAIGLGVVAVGASAAFVAAVGDPVDWAGQRVEEFKRSSAPDLSGRSSRFSFDASSDRYDLWRVAVDDARENPLLGDGSGGYQYSYTAKREVAYQDAQDAHSVELEILAELGLPGLAMFAAALTGIVLGILRARRLGPHAAALGAVALASGTYWLAHSSLDWFWTYPALTAPTFALLGAACSPPVHTLGRRSSRRVRGAVAAAAAALALVAVPLFLADRYLDDAYEGWRVDIEGAYADLDRAAALNPLSDAPLLAEGAIAREAGDSQRAIAAFREASEKRPGEWAARYLLADLLAPTDLPEARLQARMALELNPLSERTRALARELGLDPPPSPDPGG